MILVNDNPDMKKKVSKNCCQTVFASNANNRNIKMAAKLYVNA